MSITYAYGVCFGAANGPDWVADMGANQPSTALIHYAWFPPRSEIQSEAQPRGEGRPGSLPLHPAGAVGPDPN